MYFIVGHIIGSQQNSISFKPSKIMHRKLIKETKPMIKLGNNSYVGEIDNNLLPQKNKKKLQTTAGSVTIF